MKARTAQPSMPRPAGGHSIAGRADGPRASLPLFERPEFQRIAGECLRPGGLELTRRALDLWTAAQAGPCPLQPGATVLDLGCGRGATARFLASQGLRVLALDPSAELLAQTAGPSTPGIAPLQGRAQALPLATASLDAVFCECVLSVTGAPTLVLAEAARALKPGGLLVLSDLYLRSGFAMAGAAARDDRGGCVSGAMPQAALLAHLCGAGFQLQMFEDHSRLLAELAGRLIFAGLPAAELCGRGNGTAGYFLCLARRRGQ